MVWYSHLSKNFPQFVVIHTVNDSSILNEEEVDSFLEFPCFFYDYLISGSSAFSNPACPSGSSWFTVQPSTVEALLEGF